MSENRDIETLTLHGMIESTLLSILNGEALSVRKLESFRELVRKVEFARDEIDEAFDIMRERLWLITPEEKERVINLLSL